MGTKHRRVRGDAYYELVDELLTAVRRRYGTSGAGSWLWHLPPPPDAAAVAAGAAAAPTPGPLAPLFWNIPSDG